MKIRLLIIVGIVLTSTVISSVYAVSVQIRCEDLLGDTKYPRPLTLWNCLDYLHMVDNPPPQPSDIIPEKLDTIICKNAISDWLDVADRLDPIPKEIAIREQLFKQKNDATVILLNHCDVKSLTVEELQKLRSWEREDED